MDSWSWALIIVVSAAFGLWLLSHIVEALRPSPDTPAALRWAPQIPIGYADVGGVKLRFIKTGAGPTIVLLHTLRTQLDLFEKMIPDLSKRFTVYALDYPGHGYSDIPKARYDAAFFADAVAGVSRGLKLTVTISKSFPGSSDSTFSALARPLITTVHNIGQSEYANTSTTGRRPK